MLKDDWIALFAIAFFTIAGLYGLYIRSTAGKLRENRLAFLEEILTAVEALGHQDAEDVRRDKISAITDKVDSSELFKLYPSYKAYETFSAELNDHLQTLVAAQDDFTLLHEQAKGMVKTFEETFAETDLS